MTDTGRLSWIAIAPVKSMALVFPDQAVVQLTGVVGDREFAVLDPTGRLFNGTRSGELATIQASHVAETGWLRLAFPDGTTVEGQVERGEPITALFYGQPRPARSVRGPWDEALSAWAGQRLQLAAMEPGRANDHDLTVTLHSSAALAELASAGGLDAALDRRRFRMTFGIDEIPAYGEEQWIGRQVRIGDVTLAIQGNVGRCAVTTHDPETGRPSVDTLRLLKAQRDDVATTERLPFGVWAEVLTPGTVAVGDPVELLASRA